MALLYAFLAALAMAAAWHMLLTQHVLYATLALLCALLSMAAIYFLQGAAFVAVAQVLSASSSISVLLLFSTLLAPLAARPARPPTKWPHRALLATLLCACLGPWGHCALQTLQQHTTQPSPPAMAALGLQLLGPYALAFEWAGLGLLIVLVGVVYVMSARA